MLPLSIGGTRPFVASGRSPPRSLRSCISADRAARRVFSPGCDLRAVDEKSLVAELRNHPHAIESHHRWSGFSHISNFLSNYLT